MQRLAKVVLTGCLCLFSLQSHALTEKEGYSRVTFDDYGIDTFDQSFGSISFNHKDYDVQLGQNSYLPIRRSFSSYPRLLEFRGHSTFSLGQLSRWNPGLNDSIESRVRCGRAWYCYKFSDPSGASVTLFPETETTAKSEYNHILQRNLSTGVYTLTTPDGKKFTYNNVPTGNINSEFHFYDSMTDWHSSIPSLFRQHRKWGLVPSRVEDSNGNYAIFSYGRRMRLESIVTRFQTLLVKYEKPAWAEEGEELVRSLSLLGSNNSIAVYDYSSRHYSLKSVQYENTLGWNYDWMLDNDYSANKVCNPYGGCLSYYSYYWNTSPSEYSQMRVYLKKYSLPGYPNINITYSYDQTDEHFVTTALSSRKAIKRFYVKNAGSNGPVDALWRSLVKEEVWEGENLMSVVDWEYEPNVGVPGYSPGVRLSRKKEAIYSANVDDGTLKLASVTVVEHSNYDANNRSGKITYTYPNQNAWTGTTRYPKIEYVREWYPAGKNNRMDLIKSDHVVGGKQFVSFTYDSNGNLRKNTKNGVTNEKIYDGTYFELSETIDEVGTQTFYKNYEHGVPLLVEHPELKTEIRTQKMGRISSNTIHNATVSYSYNDLGELTEYFPAESEKLSTKHFYRYNQDGLVEQVMQQGDYQVITLLSGTGTKLEINVNSPGGPGNTFNYKRKFFYTENNQVATETPWLDSEVEITDQHKTFYDYDVNGVLVSVISYTGEQKKYLTTGLDTIDSIDSNDVKISEKWRPIGREGSRFLSERIHHPGNDSPSSLVKHNIMYFNDGSIKEIQKHGVIHTYEYDDRGYLKSITTPEEGVRTFEYYDNGLLAAIDRGQVGHEVYVYDDLNRLKSVSYLAPERGGITKSNVLFEYFDSERIAKGTKGSYGWEWSYDRDGLLIREAIVIPNTTDASAFTNRFRSYNTDSASYGSSVPVSDEYIQSVNRSDTLSWTFIRKYDDAGHLDFIRYPDGEIVSSFSDSQGRPKKAGIYVTDVEYFPNGHVKKLAYANGVIADFTRDSTTRMLADISYGDFWSKSYEYTNGTTIDKIIDNIDIQQSTSINFDQLYQVKNVFTGAEATPSESFEYDVQSNVIKKSSSDLEQIFEITDISNRVNGISNQGRSSSFSYDEIGRVQNDGINEYTIANDNKISRIRNLATNAVLDVDYDANDNKVRTERGGKKRYSIYTKDGKLRFEIRPEEKNWSNYIYLGSQLVAKRDTDLTVKPVSCEFKIYAGSGYTSVINKPVYIDSEGQAVDSGTCAEYKKWYHKTKSTNSWQESANKIYRTMEYHRYHQDENGGNKGFVKAFTGKLQYKREDGYYNKYKKLSWVKFQRKCYKKWKVTQKTRDHNGVESAESSVKTGNYLYATLTWYAHQSKKSCSSRSLDPNKISW